MARVVPANKLGIDFTEGDILPLLIKFATPLMIANILNSVYNTVDMIVIGQYVGSVGTVAVSQGGRMLQLLSVVSMGLSGGGQILISQQMGAKKRDQINRTVGTLFSMLFCLSVVLGFLCFVFSPQILSLLNTPEESLASSLAYLRITSVGLPFMFGYTAVSSVLRGMGDSRNPLLFIAIAATINLILDVILIAGFDMGAAGTAYATVIGQACSLLFSLTLLYRRREHFAFDFKPGSFVPERPKMKIILRIGLPMAAQSALIQITILFMVSFINAYGLVQAAAYSIGDKIIHLLNVVTQAITQSGGTIVGQNMGAGKQERVKTAIYTLLRASLLVTTVVNLICVLFPNLIFGMFTNDPEVMAYAKTFMWICVLVFYLSAVVGAFSGITTGTGNAKLSFLAGFLDGVIFRIGFCFLFGWGFGMEVTGFFLGNALARLGPVMVHCTYFFSGRWRTRKLLVEEAVDGEAKPAEAAS